MFPQSFNQIEKYTMQDFISYVPTPPPYRLQQILPTLADLSNNNGHAYILNV